MISAVQESVAERLRNYGTAVTVGVFIGAALTTGVMCGAATVAAARSEELKGLWTMAKQIATGSRSPAAAANDVPHDDTDGDGDHVDVDADAPGVSFTVKQVSRYGGDSHEELIKRVGLLEKRVEECEKMLAE